MNATQHTHLRLVRSHKASQLAFYKSVQNFLALHREYTVLQTAMKDCMAEGKPLSMPDLVQSMGRTNAILREMLDLKREMDSQ